MNYKIFYTSIYRIFLIYFLGLIIFQFFRIILVINFSSFTEVSNYKLDLLKAIFYMGFKFDTVVVLYVLLVPFLFSLVSAFVPEQFQALHKINVNLIFWIPFVLFVLAIIVMTCNYYFYKFFQSNFNLLVFGLIDDDTRVVAYSMWTDYPVIRIFLTWIIVTILLFYTIKKIIAKTIDYKHFTNKWLHALFVILICVFFAIGVRGSLGVFPIEKDDATISPNTFINSITMNGVFSLKDAISDYKNYSISTDSSVTLSKYGYSNKKEALLDLNGDGADVNNFTDTTSESSFLDQNPPHIVFCLMESMSNYYFDLHSPSLNLMGELENQIKSCIVFRNFTSGRNGTIHSLEGLMVNTPLTPLSQSSFMNVSLASSVAKTFLDKGYETNFITGAKLGWRNLGKYLSFQYFNNLEGSATILEKIPNAKSCEWGAYDEFVFQRVADILKQSKKPQFIFVLSTTNHTPYQLPETYKPYPVNISDSIRNVLRCDASISVKNFTAYQYANNCIGEFIKNLKSTGLANNTIFAATGDHNTLALFDYDDAHMLMKCGVPFLLYIPANYKPHLIDITRFGSHKDIFPTLFNLSLSKTEYYKSGNNLFGSESDYYYALNDYYSAFNKHGCALITGKPIYFKWYNKTLLSCTEEENPEIKRLLKQAKAYSALLELDMQRQLISSKKKN